MPSDWTSALPWSPAPQTSVWAFSTSPDLSVTRVGATDVDDLAGLHLDASLLERLLSCTSRRFGLNIEKSSGPASTSVIARLLLRRRRVVLAKSLR